MHCHRTMQGHIGPENGASKDKMMGFQHNKAVSLYYALSRKERDGLAYFLKGQRPSESNLRIVLIEAYLSNFSAMTTRVSLSDMKARFSEASIVSANRLPALLNLLYKLMTRYLATLEMDRNPGMEELFALRQLRNHHQKWDNTVFKGGKKKVESVGDSPETYLMHYWMEREQVSVSAEKNPRGKQLDLNIAHLQFLLNRFTALQQITHWCEQASLDRVRRRSGEAEDRSVDALELERLRYAELRILAKYWPLLAFMLDLLDAIRQEIPVPDGISRLAALKEEVATDHHAYLWMLLHNAYTGVLNKGMGGTPELFQLLKMGFEERYVYPEGKLRASFYKNLMQAAAGCGEVKEGRICIESYRIDLPKGQEGVYWLCLAIADFEETYFDAARRNITEVMQSNLFNDLYFGIGARFLQAKINFELGEMEDVRRDLAGLKVFLRNHKSLSAAHKKTYEKRLRYFIRLHTLYDGRRTLAARLIHDLENVQVDDKAWLFNKAVAAREAGK